MRGMHTDEYEIALARELEVCKIKIREINRILSNLEKTYALDTEEFVREFRDGKFSGAPQDIALWIDSHEALKRWNEMKRQYEELLGLMKI